MPRFIEASSNGRTAGFESAHEGSNPSASANSPLRAEPVTPVPSAPTARRLLLAPLGALPRALLDDVATALTRFSGVEVILGAALARPAYAYNEGRGQYHTTAILRRLSLLPPASPQGPVLGLTDADLFVPESPFVFVEADRAARSAVVSIFRLQHGPEGRPAEPERLRHRVQAEAVHALGLLMGLSNCHDIHCAMALAHKPSDTDRKATTICGTCGAALAKSGV